MVTPLIIMVGTHYSKFGGTFDFGIVGEFRQIRFHHRAKPTYEGAGWLF
jgi:hypothetical protein